MAPHPPDACILGIPAVQGYIDPIIYNEENNALLRKADNYRAEINMLNKNIRGDASHLRAATALPGRNLSYSHKEMSLIFSGSVSSIFDHYLL